MPMDPQALARLRTDLPRSVRLLERRRDGLQPYLRAHPRPHEDPRREAARFVRWSRRAVRDGLAPPLLADLAAAEAACALLRSRKPRRPGVFRKPRRAPNVRLLHLRHDVGPWLAGRRGRPAARESWLAVHLGFDGRPHPVRMDRHDWEVLRLANGRRTEAGLVEEVAGRCDVWNREVQRSIRELRREGLLCPDR